MSVMGPDGKILQPGGGWWSPYGDTDEEIQKNMRVNKMPNAPDAVRINPGYFTGSKNGDEVLRDFLDLLEHWVVRRKKSTIRSRNEIYA